MIPDNYVTPEVQSAADSTRTEAELRAHRACAAYQEAHRRYMAFDPRMSADVPIEERVALDLEIKRRLAVSVKLKLEYEAALDALHRDMVNA